MEATNVDALDLAAILWRRRVWVIASAVLVALAALPVVLPHGGTLRSVVRVPYVGDEPVVSDRIIAAELTWVVAPAKDYSVTITPELVVLERGVGKSREDSENRLGEIASSLEAWLAAILHARLDQLDREIAAFEKQLGSLRSGEKGLIDGGPIPSDYATLVSARGSVRPGGVLGPPQAGPPPSVLTASVAVVAIASVVGIAAAFAVEGFAEVRRRVSTARGTS